jgi:circadian clock protein KaiC
MVHTRDKGKVPRTQLARSPTGIPGLDEITVGGLPKGRPTLVCGRAGCGKTLLGMEFLVRGALQYNEPGVFMTFEEDVEDLTRNFASLGFDLKALSGRNLISLDFVRIERSEIEETGEYDLEGLFVRLGYAIDSIGAKRVVLDTIEALFSGLSNTSILRAELRRLFHWLKEKGVTAIITAESGEGTLTRHGLEEYVADCVIWLDNRVTEQISTRRLRILKYRGASHGTNEYPFLIDEEGISVLPITSLALDHAVSIERVSTGVPRLDTMLGGKGYFRGSTILVSGMAGTGKTSLAAAFCRAACQRGERCLYFAMEESRDQIIRNMRSIGIDLEPWAKKGLLHLQAARPTSLGLEMHLAVIYKLIDQFQPRVVILDPITNLISIGSRGDVKLWLTRLIDYLKVKQITALLTNLSHASNLLEQADIAISSLMDTWVFLADMEMAGERNRSMYILKSRGMAHSNQVREFLLTDHGIDLVNVYLGSEGYLMGSARAEKEAQKETESIRRKESITRQERELRQKQKAFEAQIAALQAQFEHERNEIERSIAEEGSDEERVVQEREVIGRIRQADIPETSKRNIDRKRGRR